MTPQEERWSAAVLKDIDPAISRLWIAKDPDELLASQEILSALTERGFTLIPYDDPIRFRWAYENQFRAEGNLVIHLRSSDEAIVSYDVRSQSRVVSLSLAELLPHLYHPVVRDVERGVLPALYNASEEYFLARLGQNATIDFVLHHGYRVVADLIDSEAELMPVLIKLHHKAVELPKVIAERFVTILRKQESLARWPLQDIVRDRNAFWSFLQERWPLYLTQQLRDRHVAAETPEGEPLRFPGPQILPFGHDNVRAHVMNLFLEGKLHPVPFESPQEFADPWIVAGISSTRERSDPGELSLVSSHLEATIPGPSDPPTSWIEYGLHWAEYAGRVYREGDSQTIQDMQRNKAVIDAQFLRWMQERFASLISMSPSVPVLLHHVTRKLVRDVEEGKKVALVVVDGMSMDQWTTVRPFILDGRRTYIFRESGTFAWVPTITSVSRQALFSGEPPAFFSTSLFTTNQEQKRWYQYWEQNGIPQANVRYKRSLNTGDPVAVMDELLGEAEPPVVGLVVDMVDKITHGTQLGADALHGQIVHWCKQGFLPGLVETLVERGYVVWITSDHGSTEAMGRGSPQEGSIAQTRGERVRMYSSNNLRSVVAQKCPWAIPWGGAGLPENVFPLIAGGNDAFITEGKATVTHGGISLSEVIVPLVRIKRSSQ